MGKTTLLEICANEGAPAPQRAYVTLDDMDARALARRDPALFLQTWQPPLVIDEIQYAPELFSAIKIIRDCSLGFFEVGDKGNRLTSVSPKPLKPRPSLACHRQSKRLLF